MPFLCKLTDGTDEVDLYYGAAAGFSLLDEGFRPGRPEARTLFGGIDETRLTRHYDGKRRIPLALHLKGSTDDDLLDRINALQCLIKQARDFHLSDVGNEVFLEFKLSNATFTSRFPVLTGELDIDHLMSMFVKNAKTIHDLPVVLTCEPYWEAIETYSLDNYCRNPHFVEDGNADGLADNWAEIGAPTTTIDIVNYLLGKKSQKVVTDDAGDDGIVSANAADTETSGVAYAWVYVPTGDEVAVELYDASTSTVKATALYSTEGWEEKIDALGETWKRLVISSTELTSGNNHQLRILRRSEDATQATTFYVDQCYIELGRSDTPVGWISFRDIKNHKDSDVGDIPYGDVADIPGDIDALMRLEVKNTSGADQHTLRVFMDNAIARYSAHHEAEDVNTGGTDYPEADNSAGYYNESASVTGYVINPNTPYRIDLAPATINELRGAFRLLGRARDEKTWPTTGLFRWRVSEYQTIYLQTQGRWVEGNGKEVIDLGTVRLQPELAATNKPTRLSLDIQAARKSGESAFTLEVDYFLLAPLYQAVVAETFVVDIVVANNEYFVIDSIVGLTNIMDSAKAYEKHAVGRIGSPLTLPPLSEARMYFLMGEPTPDRDHEIDASMRVTLTYRPRGVHLRGGS